MIKVALVLLLFLSGCIAHTLPQIRYETKKNLMKLTSQMTTDQVLKVMGNKPIDAHSRSGKFIGTIYHPYKTQEVVSDEKKYKILFYYSHIRHSDAIITNSELTPIIFNEDKLVGVGWSFLDKLKNNL